MRRRGRRWAVVGVAVAVSLIAAGVGVRFVHLAGRQANVTPRAVRDRSSQRPDKSIAPCDLSSRPSPSVAQFDPSLLRRPSGSGTTLPTTASRPARAAGPLIGTEVIIQPSGTTRVVPKDTSVLILLAAPAQGEWGAAAISCGNPASIAIQGQTVEAGGALSVRMVTIADGIVTVTIPSLGNSAGSWTLTLTVSGEPPLYSCAPNGVCP
jgi:hypothetical protein